MEARGGTDAAVLLALYGWPEEPGLIFTERRADLRRHAGEISFPGGRRDEIDADLSDDGAARGAGGDRPRAGAGRAGRGAAAGLDLRHRLPRPPLRRPHRRTRPSWTCEPNPTEVETVLTFSLEVLRESYEMRRLVRRGVPIHTPTYEVEGQLIWGATARILGDLLERLD